MDGPRFEHLVARAVTELPDEFLSQLDNVDVVVEGSPNVVQLRKSRLRQGVTLLGLYEGVPQTKRGRHYGLVLPDKITIFQGPIEARCRSEDEIMTMVRDVVRHEIAHHFGISETRLRQLREGKD